MRILLVLSLCLLVAGPAAGEPLEEAAEAVLAAHRAGRALTEFAARAEPDPWIVADELLRRGEREVAIAFAKAAVGKDVEALPAHVEGWRSGEGETAAREALARARAALAAKDLPKALEALADLAVPKGTVVAVRLNDTRGRALSALRKFEEGMAAFGAAAEEAERIGWLARAGAACRQAAVCANERTDTPAALRWSERNLAIQRRRGDRLGEAQALSDMGGMRQVLGKAEEARAALDRALAILDGDLAASPEALVCRATVLFHLARLHRFQDQLGQAIALGERALENCEKAGEQRLLAWTLANLGDFELAAGEVRKAETHLDRALKMMRARRDGRGESFTLIKLADCLADRGELGRAAELLRKALAAGEAWNARWVVAQALCGLGSLETRNGSAVRALEHWQRARGLLRELGDTGRELWLLAELAATHWSLGDGKKCRELLAEAVSRAEQIPFVRMRVRALNRMAGVLRETGETVRAAALRRRALELAESIGDRLGIADALGGLGADAIVRWELEEAFAQATRSLAIYRELGLPLGVTEALNNLGLVHRRRGAYAKAQACHEEALLIAVRTGNRPSEATALLDLGDIHWGRGSYAQALSRQEQCLALARETGSLTLQAEASLAVAITLGRIGRTDRARGLFDESLRIREGLADRRGAAESRADLGVLLHDLGDHRGARELIEIARDTYREMGELRAVAILGANLGVVLGKMGELTDARRFLQDALRAETARAHGHGILQLRLNLAWIDRLDGRLDAAREAFGELRAEAERQADAALLFQSLNGLAKVERDAGRLREAVAAARLAVGCLGDVLRGFGEEESASVRARYAGHHDVFTTGARAAAALGSAEDLSFFLESGRAGALLESLGGRDRIAGAALSPALAEAIVEARAAEEVAWRRYSAARDAEGDDVDARRAELERAREQRILVGERVRREAKEAGSVVYPEADSLATIRGRLGAGEALVVYTLFEDEALALVVEGSGARIVRLGDSARIRAAGESLVRAGRRGARGVRVEDAETVPEDDGAATAIALRALVAAPLGLDEKTSRVLISADGILSYVPFCLLLGDREVVHVPSGTTYGLLTRERAKRGDGILAVGDPDYPEAGSGGARSATRFADRLSALPGTREEAKAVGDVVLLGAEASEAGFAAAVGMRPRWRAVHLACHGLVDPRSPMLSALALTPDAESDGLLFCRDVFQMQIPADLVVLSACETARGKVYEAEGIVGLTRAFLCAGAPRVLCSLWKVDDEATRALMVRFYRLWKKEGIPAARALRQAQAHVRAQEKWSDPYYWAAWTLWGLGD